MGRRNSAKVYQEENEAIAARPSTPNAPRKAVDIAEELEATDRAFFQHLWKYERLLPPLGSHLAPWRRRWSSLLLLLTTYEACYIPFCTAFQLPRNVAGVFSLPGWAAALQWLIDVLFVIDIFLMFRTTLQSTTLAITDVVTDVKEIRQLYLSTTFRLDVSRRRSLSDSLVFSYSLLLSISPPLPCVILSSFFLSTPAPSRRVHSCWRSFRSNGSPLLPPMTRRAPTAAWQYSAHMRRSRSASRAWCTRTASSRTTARASSSRRA